MPDGSQFGREITSRDIYKGDDHRIQMERFNGILAEAKAVAFWDQWLARDVATKLERFCGKVLFNRPDGPWGGDDIAVKLRETGQVSYNATVRYALFRWAGPIIENKPSIQERELGEWQRLVETPYLGEAVRGLEDRIKNKGEADALRPGAVPGMMPCRPDVPHSDFVAGQMSMG